MRTYEDICWAVDERRRKLQGVHGMVVYIGREEAETIREEHRYLFKEEAETADMTIFGEQLILVDADSHLGLGIELEG